jgi:hypothetical protein
LAQEAYGLVQVNPRRALTVAERALATAAKTDAEAQVAALHALAWAQLQLGDPRAIATVKAGIRTAERHGDQVGVALLRRRLAFSHAMAGETRAARREIEAAIALLKGRERAQSEVFRLAIQRHAHAVDPSAHHAALADAAKALRVLRRDGDAIWEARLLYNRGLLRFDRGELAAADADLGRAHTLYRRIGAEDAARDAAVARAELALQRGEILACLKTLDEVQTALPPGYVSHNVASCRTAALIQARLLPEARAQAQAYIERCERVGLRDEAARTRLDLAALAMMSSDPIIAVRLAATAARSFAAQGKPVNAALARAVRLRAQLVEGSVRPASIRSGTESATVLARAGWRRDALRTRLSVSRAALLLGSRVIARRQLDLAAPLYRTGTVADRIELLHARALLRLAEGRAAEAEGLLERALVLLEDYRAALGAIELRAAASIIGRDVGQTALRLAVASRRPEKILSWAERLRANALRLPLVRPAADAKLRVLQAELRRTAAAGASVRQAQLEAAIRSRSRLVAPEKETRAAIPDTRDATRLLGDRVLVEYLELDDTLYALTVAEGRLTFHELGSRSATTELEWLRFALGRLARGDLSAAQRAAARDNARAAAASLNRLLVEPLVEAVREAPLVVVPTGPLHALPWGTLPSLRGRPVVVTPSLATWAELASTTRSRRRKAVLVGGPRLLHSTWEVRDLATLRPEATALHGKAATADAVLVALDGAALAHVACHGHFRADSPLFSSFELADGKLDVYELQRLRRAPEVVVLSACNLALSSLHPGDELLGLASALLGMGTRTIVASVVPVPDAAARRLMLAFHRNLLGGSSPADALASAQAGARTAAGFVCLGSG